MKKNTYERSLKPWPKYSIWVLDESENAYFEGPVYCSSRQEARELKKVFKKDYNVTICIVKYVPEVIY